MSKFIRSMDLYPFILLAALLLAEAASVAAQPTTPTDAAQPATLQPATSAAVPVDHQTYTRKAEDELQEWKTKLSRDS